MSPRQRLILSPQPDEQASIPTACRALHLHGACRRVDPFRPPSHPANNDGGTLFARIAVSTAAALLALLTTTGGCTKLSMAPPTAIEPLGEGVPPACEGSPCFIFDRLDRWVAGGAALESRRWAEQKPPAFAEPEVLRLDFESGELDSLLATTMPELVAVEPPTGGRRLGRALRMGGTRRHVGRVETPPLALDGRERWTLRWFESSSAVDVRRAGSAGPTLTFYEIPTSVSDPVAWLGSGFNRWRARIDQRRPAGRLFLTGSEGWHPERRSVQAPEGATHLVIAVEGGRAQRGVEESQVWVDDLSLHAEAGPLWESGSSGSWREPGADPLAVRAQLSDGTGPAAARVRDAVLAPAPSVLRARLRVPEKARLSIGFGLLPGLAEPEGAVGFAIEVIDAEGARHTLRSGRRQSPGWDDFDLDLGPFAGQAVTLALSTWGRPAPDDALESLSREPEGLAAFSLGRLSGPATPRKLAILVLLDTVSAQRSSSWGSPRPTTPHLDRIAKDSVVFERAIAPSPWTLPSAASILTGLQPPEHRARRTRNHEGAQDVPLSSTVETVAERLRQAGWDTRAWINNPHLSPELSGLDQGFRHYLDYASIGSPQAARPAVEQALAEIGTPADGNRFLLVHMMDPHLPYRPEGEFLAAFTDPAYAGPFFRGMSDEGMAALLTSRVFLDPQDRAFVAGLHEGVLAFTDSQVGALWDAARRTGDELLFVVVADHGEELWEHGGFEHGHTMFDELLHVPLLVHRTGGPSGLRVAPAVSTARVAGTVLEFAGLTSADAPALRLDEAIPHEAIISGWPLYGRGARAIESKGWKYVLQHHQDGREGGRAERDAPTWRLFHLPSDPGEERDRRTDLPEEARRLHEELVEHAVRTQPGAWVVWADPVAAGETVTLRWSRRGGPLWGVLDDFLWPPLAGGSGAPPTLTARRTLHKDTARLTVTVRGGPALLLLDPGGPGGRVQLRGGTQGRALADRGVLDADALLAAIRSSLDTPTPRPWRARLAVGRRRADAAPAVRTERGQEALRALGYVE